ncbi:MAG TPA: helix-turn-helix domain-containing protein [Bryobacteraceae bacterium]|nr:helix-turn-helix domain-containing protein [Bryobacteraceae bacterium]HXR15923.1 helix-turn-helix domain-containing protein [Terriglobales bacterium]HZW96129.1 helix-turn-helix domain-containing protein [Candidatus Eremiobacteraceae bacterium]
MSVDRLIDEKEAAEILGCTVSAMRKWRFLGKGPAYCRVGRLVRYSGADLAAFLDANRVQPGAAR